MGTNSHGRSPLMEFAGGKDGGRAQPAKPRVSTIKHKQHVYMCKFCAYCIDDRRMRRRRTRPRTRARHLVPSSACRQHAPATLVGQPLAEDHRHDETEHRPLAARQRRDGGSRAQSGQTPAKAEDGRARDQRRFKRYTPFSDVQLLPMRVPIRQTRAGKHPRPHPVDAARPARHFGY